MEFSLLTANFNNKDLTDAMIRSFRKQYEKCHVYVIDNSTEQKYTTELEDITIIDNFNYKNTPDVYEHAVTNYHKIVGRPSVLHSGTIEYAFNKIEDDYIVLCDNDVMFYPSIKRLLNEFDCDKYDIIGEVGIAEGGWPTNRLFPFFCLINLKKVKQNNIHFYTPDSIVPYEKDTGAYFLEELNKNNIKIQNIKLTDYITHLGHASWDDIDVDSFLEKTKNLRPMINIVFTTYYKNSSICETLYSIFSQSYKDWELIVIDLSKEKYFESWLNEVFIKNDCFKKFEKLKSNIKIITFAEQDDYNDYIKELTCYDEDFVVFLKDNEILAEHLFENIYDISHLYSYIEMISSDYIPILYDENELPCINQNLPKNSVNIENHSKVNIGEYFFNLYNGFPQLRNFHKWKSHNSIIILKKNTLLNNRFSIFYNNLYNDFSFCVHSIFLPEVYILDVCCYKIIYNNEKDKTYEYCAELEIYLNETNFKKNRIYYTPKNRNFIV